MQEEVFLSPKIISYSGIPPRRLLEQVANTAPFIFNKNFLDQLDLPDLRKGDVSFIKRLWDYKKTLEQPPSSLNSIDEPSQMPVAEYFKFCLSAHYATVGTLIPTDVDIHIREKLWRWALAYEQEALSQMTQTVLEASHWDYTPVSNRFIENKKNA